MQKQKELKIDNYTVTQAPNHHVAVLEDGKMIFHAQQSKELSDDELKELLNMALELRNSVSIYLKSKEKIEEHTHGKTPEISKR